MEQPRLTDVFVEMADTLVDDFDVIDFLQTLTERCVELLEVDAAGLLLTDAHGAMQLIAASSEPARALEDFQLRAGQGPALECFRSGKPVMAADLSTGDPWPFFASAATDAGFTAVHALPMRLRADVIGALDLFGADPGPLDREQVRIGQALADIATVGLLQQRAIRRGDVVAEQLQGALTSRVLVEQAKGLLAERLQVSVAEAFRILRSTARERNRRLSDLARDLLEGTTTMPSRAAG
jgi:transcriptional regulator with GAF, ATPase, and Fis domain